MAAVILLLPEIIQRQPIAHREGNAALKRLIESSRKNFKLDEH